MTIHCTDLSSERLFFAIDFLSLLNQSDCNPVVHVQKDWSDAYGSLFNSFPALNIATNPHEHQQDQVHLLFADLTAIKRQEVRENTIVFPILMSSELEEYKDLKEQREVPDSFQFIPLDSDDVKNTGIVIPDSRDSMDMLIRMLNPKPMPDYRILISAGPTIEDIDPVRFLSNRSTGKMGIALARAAYRKGAQVKLIAGPVQVEIPSYLEVEKVRSAKEMSGAVVGNFDHCDVYIGCAAVADFTPESYRDSKIKKHQGMLELKLKKTEDILMQLQGLRKHQLVAGFSVETDAILENSRLKLKKKELDLIVINNPLEKGAAFGAETNRVTILDPDGQIQELPILSKLQVGEEIMDRLFNLIQKRKNETTA
jgi:hypothetical protein